MVGIALYSHTAGRCHAGERFNLGVKDIRQKAERILDGSGSHTLHIHPRKEYGSAGKHPHGKRHGVGPAVIAGFEQASRRGDIMIRQLGGKVDQKFLTAVLLVKFKEKRTYPLYVELGHTIMIEGKGFQP